MGYIICYVVLSIVVIVSYESQIFVPSAYAMIIVHIKQKHKGLIHNFFFLSISPRMKVHRYFKPCVKHAPEKLPKVIYEFRIFVTNNGCSEPKIDPYVCEEMFH